MRRLVGRLIESYYGAIALILNVGLVILGAWLYSAVHAAEWRLSDILLPLGAVILVGLTDFFVKKVYDRRKARHTHEKLIGEFLEAAALSLLTTVAPPNKHLRVNIMFPNRGNLVIRHCYGFLPEDKDRHIQVPIGTGCAGQAWLHDRAMVADITQLSRTDDPPHWGLPTEEIAKIRPSLKSVFSTPIKSGKHNDKIAILNLDSDNTREEMRFKDERIHQIIFCFVAALGSVLDDM